MRFEKYQAEDMQEAFRLIKADLGPDAVVIQTRKVRPGVFGWLKRPVYEVIAAVDEEAKQTKFAASVAMPTAAQPSPASAGDGRMRPPAARPAALPARTAGQAPAQPRAAAPASAGRPSFAAAPAAAGLGDAASRQAGAVSAPVQAPGASATPTASASRGANAYAASPKPATGATGSAAPAVTPERSATQPWAGAPAGPEAWAGAAPNGNGHEPADAGAPVSDGSTVTLQSSDVTLLRDMQNNMADLTTAMNRLSKQAQFGHIANFSPVLVNLYQRLVDQELAEDLAQDIVLKVNTELGTAGVNNYDLVREYVRKHVTELITVTGPPRLMTGQAKCIFLIGPTGVGKTTTLAKLAANYSLVEHKKVSLVTVDTFRIAAIPQLRTYADIIGVPMEVVYTPAELGEVLKRFSDRDLVLVDTPGGSPRNTKQLEVLKEYLDAIASKEVYLAVASPTKYRDMVEAFKRFSISKIDGLLFTKIDETDLYGPLVNLLSETKARLTYLTTGQNVPQDIELADSVKMAELLLAEKAQS
ncbi:MAG TPA: flagellar biosynthesis protein FlhF [Chloroflexota bacterium]|jgi:flagellar biosynthesis protein FlhF|nr:flagellar biosynthesis protein FlhF [Chloroflexota bacterium]